MSSQTRFENPHTAVHYATVVLPPAEEQRLERLLLALADAPPWDRAAAAMRLGELRPVTVAAVAALARALDDGDGRAVRWAAAHALGRLGPAARAAIPALKRALTADPSGDVRTEANASLWRIGPSAAFGGD